MNGARMRSYSLSGTRPGKDQPLGPAAERARDRAHADLARRRAARPARRGFRPCPARHTRAPAPVRSFRHLLAPIGLPEPPPAISCCGPKKHPDPDDRTHASRLRRPAPADPARPAAASSSPLIVLASMVGLIWLLSFALSAGGFGVVDFILVVLFAITLPWSVIGFWNATIGLVHHALGRSGRGRDAGFGARARRRADHGEDRDPVVRAQRGHRARHPQHRADDGGDRGLRRGATNSMSSS